MIAPLSTTSGISESPLSPGGLGTRRGNTVWGLGPLELHNHYWASLGIQVVRQGEPIQIVSDAELYLLTDPRSLVIFKIADVMEALNWIKPQVLFVRLHDNRERGYREKALTDSQGRFIRFQRLYDASDDLRLARFVITPDRQVARLWQEAPEPLAGWRRLRRSTPRHDRVTLSVRGNVFDRSLDREVARFMRALVSTWRHPNSTITRARELEPQVWVDPQTAVEPGAKFIAPVWVGSGRRVAEGITAIGPAVVWDDPQARPPTPEIEWLQIEPTRIPQDASTARDVTALDRMIKRMFDIPFSLIALALTLPLYPFICLAIWLEDGRPFFFSHRRETLNGREFRCLKFRSMRKNAQQIMAQLRAQNQADGPQFYIENDPRLTRVGRIIRKYNLDELPQFFNVLFGDMSVVGPRPSPRNENQYCPAWREARLSVRPGITGLWQIRRTRQAGSDFQEWIKYDIEYVENRSWGLDLYIIWRTVAQILRKVTRA